MEDKDMFKTVRSEHGITQKEASRILGVSKRTVEEWEAGNMKPKGGFEPVIMKLKIAGHLTADGREALISGELSWSEASASYNIQETKKLSKWGTFGDTFSKCWERIPESIEKIADPESLAELVDSIKETYDDGVEYGKHHTE